MSDLIKRLEEAGEGSRELDSLLWLAEPAQADCTFIAYAEWSVSKPTCWADFGIGRQDGIIAPRSSVDGLIYRDGPYQVRCHGCPPRYTTSLDAALALAERVHPGFHAALYTSDGDRSRQAMITVPTRKDGPFNATAATIPLALCIAVLKAVADSPSPRSVGMERSGMDQAQQDQP